MRVALAAAAAMVASACSRPGNVASAGSHRAEALRVNVVRSFPHDRAAFTQGLEYHDGHLYESTGIVGRSSLRIVDATSGEVLRTRAVDAQVFAEGLARVGDKLVQLTWQDGRAFVWSATTLAPIAEHRYDGEGWGLCYDGNRLVMSDGTAKLTFRDPTTFAKTGEVEVRRDGLPQPSLNELECVGDVVYANVWQDTHIARIDARTGDVTGWIDASGLLRSDEAVGTDVLNGIAWVPERRRFVVTGKFWPRAFEVELVPAGR